MYCDILKPILHKLPPELAHWLAIKALRLGLIPKNKKSYSNLNLNLFNKTMRSPLCLAAGFDKNGEAIKPLLDCGFSGVEVGTITRLPHQGNPGPRLFRSPKQLALVNNMGLNNRGLDYVKEKLNQTHTGERVVGVSIGSCSYSLYYDYRFTVEQIYRLGVDYIVLNVSCPNIRSKNKLRDTSKLKPLIEYVKTALPQDYPLFVKISPDVNASELNDIVGMALDVGLFGLVISNTTTKYNGGLSGKPLFGLSNVALKEAYRLSKGKLVLIGSGGVMNGADAYTKIKCGATLVQIYTGLVYGGFGVIDRIHEDLTKLLLVDGFTNITQAIGIETC